MLFHTFQKQYLDHSHCKKLERAKNEKAEEEREIAEGLGLIRFMRTDEVFAVDSVCTYDPKILRSFPFGQASRESQWAHRSSDSFLPHERSGLLSPLRSPSPSINSLDF